MHCECSQTHFWNVLCRACSPLRPYGSFERPPFCCFTNKPNSSLPKITGARKPAPKKNQLEEIRLKAVEKRASKLTPVEHFEECCSRSTSPPPARKVYIACSACCDWLSVSVLCRKCLTDGIPEPVLKQCRNRFLNYPTREQRKSYILSLRTPRAR